MILDQLKQDIRDAIVSYYREFPSSRDLPRERKKDIRNIENILAEKNPIVVFEKLSAYVESLDLMFFNWLPFIDLNNFYWKFKNVLDKDIYQEANFYKQVAYEQICMKTVNAKLKNKSIQEVRPRDQSDEIFVDMKLLRAENRYLYATVKELQVKVSELEDLCKGSLNRVQLAQLQLSNAGMKPWDSLHFAVTAKSLEENGISANFSENSYEKAADRKVSGF